MTRADLTSYVEEVFEEEEEIQELSVLVFIRFVLLLITICLSVQMLQDELQPWAGLGPPN